MAMMLHPSAILDGALCFAEHKLVFKELLVQETNPAPPIPHNATLADDGEP